MLGAIAVLAAVATTIGSGTSATGASSNTVVGATVPSSSELSTLGCPPSTAGITSFGLVMAGSSSVTTGTCTVTFGSSNDTSMVRISQDDRQGRAMFLTTTGALKTGFNGTGRQTSTPGTTIDIASGVLAQRDGKVLVSGVCYNGSNDDFCTARFNANGTVDGTWNGTGTRRTPISGQNDNGRTIAIQADGRAVQAGWCGTPGAWDACVARYTTSGGLDPTFDGDGVASFAVGTGEDLLGAILVEPSGSIVLGGHCDIGGQKDACVAKLRSDGSLDTSWSGDGIVTIPIGNTDPTWELARQDDGKLLVGGTCDMGFLDFQMCVARLNVDGSLDLGFSGDGKWNGEVLTGWNEGWSLAAAPDGKVLIGGRCESGGAAWESCVIRLTSTGSPDATFDGDGRWYLDLGGVDEKVVGMHVDDDLRPTIVGTCAGAGRDFCLARLTPTGSLDTRFDGDGRAQTSFSGGSDEPDGSSIGVDGELLVAGRCSDDFCVANFATGGTISDYANSVTDWNDGATAFGACLDSVAAGATATWTVPGGGCLASDGPEWNGVPTTPTKVAHTTVAATTGATARLKFGIRTAQSTAPGTYRAPVEFEVLAPNA